MQVGDMVHEMWRGRCHAAVVTNFWEDENTARLTVFEDGGPVIHARVLSGEANDDGTWPDQTFHGMDEPHPEPFVEPEVVTSYEDLKKPELVALAEAKGLDTSGTKADIIERLETASPEEDMSDTESEATPVEGTPEAIKEWNERRAIGNEVAVGSTDPNAPAAEEDESTEDAATEEDADTEDEEGTEDAEPESAP